MVVGVTLRGHRKAMLPAFRYRARMAARVDPDCLFCKIVSGAIPAAMVVETSLSLAFRDINPIAPTHVLVIPRDHIAHAAAVEAADGPAVADLLTTARQVAAQDGLEERGYRLVFNVGRDSGNSVAHLHLHVIGGRAMGWPPFGQ